VAVSYSHENRGGEMVAGERLRIKEGEGERSAWVSLCTQSGRSVRSAHAREFRGGVVASAEWVNGPGCQREGGVAR
jgi:cell wall assembly regulator SMI1